jgi:hypothetical protein
MPPRRVEQQINFLLSMTKSTNDRPQTLANYGIKWSEEKKGIATHSGVKLRCAGQAINNGAFFNYINTCVCVCVLGEGRGGNQVWSCSIRPGDIWTIFVGRNQSMISSKFVFMNHTFGPLWIYAIYEHKTLAQRDWYTVPLHHTAHTGKPVYENINAYLVANNKGNVHTV